MDRNARIFVAGTEGFLREALLAELGREGYKDIAGQGSQPQLTDEGEVRRFFSAACPEYVFLIGGKSGGIRANQKYPAELMLDNLLVGCNVIESAHRYGVRKLLYLGSSCIYPKFTEQPMRVEALMTGKLEATNEAYALAKLAGLRLCQAYREQFGAPFILAIPANVFGPGDDFSDEDSHVVAALIRRMHEAKILGREYVEIWGTGLPRREFIFSEDLAKACLFLMHAYDSNEPINIGIGCDWSIAELAALVKEAVGYNGELRFDPSKPDGMPAKLLDSSKLRDLGWKASTSIREALAVTYQWFLQREESGGRGDVRAIL